MVDDDGGGLTTVQVTRLLNDYALDGWKLVSAYANELGHNSTSGGFGGFSIGANSTVDQHILILERFVRFQFSVDCIEMQLCNRLQPVSIIALYFYCKNPANTGFLFSQSKKNSTESCKTAE